MKTCVYISGRITGNAKYKEQFEKAEKELNGWFDLVVNPTKEVAETTSYRNAMITDIQLLLKCTHIYMLRGWRRSRGARLERHIAKVLGLVIEYQKRGDK